MNDDRRDAPLQASHDESDRVEEDIPLVDMKAFVQWRTKTSTSANHGAAQGFKEAVEVAHRVGDACRKYGFMCCVNTGIPDELMDSVMIEAKKFFASTMESKRTADAAGSLYARGYEKLDGKEAFECGRGA